MNICGCLVHVVPEAADETSAALSAVEGVEMHAQSEDGRFVVVVEDTATRLASEIIMDLHQIPGVVSLTLNYHHFEEQGALRGARKAPPLRPDGGLIHDNI